MVSPDQGASTPQEKIDRLNYLIELHKRDLALYQEWYNSAKNLKDKTQDLIASIEEEIHLIRQGQLAFTEGD